MATRNAPDRRPGKRTPGTKAKKTAGDGKSPRVREKTATTGKAGAPRAGKARTDDVGKSLSRRPKSVRRSAPAKRGANTGSTPPIVVGMVASAGGLEAFSKFFDNLPASSDSAFILVPHLDPHRYSMMVELLQRHTPLPICEATGGERIEAGHVYVIAPNSMLMLRDSVIQVSAPIEREASGAVLDIFLNSLAEDQKEKAVGIVLSGTGTHGSMGALAIKAHGGLVVVQEPTSASQPGMPRAAIAAGAADHVLAPEAMSETLSAYARHITTESSGKIKPLTASPDQLSRILALLRARTRFDFRSYRKNMLLRRVQRRMGLNAVDKLSAYLDMLRSNADEVKRLARDLHVSVTSFFRDPEAFRQIESIVIPSLLCNANPDAGVRIWVPACATGEEAYSLAILFMDAITARNAPSDLQVFGTDVDAHALDVARRGVYPASALEGVSSEQRARYFTKLDDANYQVQKSLREKVLFAQQNILGDAPFSRVDLVSCRNLLIYLEPEMQQRIISLLYFSLNPGGYLLLGPSETIGPHLDLFEPVSKKWRLFRRLEPTRRRRIDFPVEAGMERHDLRRPPLPTSAQPAALAQSVERALLDAYAPASIVVDQTSYEALYFSGATQNYLQMPAGRPTHDLTALVREGLRERLRAAVHKATREGQPATIGGARIKRGNRKVGVRITARPFPVANSPAKYLLVSFEDEVIPSSEANRRADSKRDEDVVARQLEHQLKDTRDALQSTIEELESANEELKTSNEEVMSMNEELQSTNEELETSKEELQSLNEELTTVNNQLQEKLTLLEAANNDMANLMASADTPTVFLGPDHAIKRFTSAASRLFRLIESDVGRPIHDIKWRFDDRQLETDADDVLRTLAPAEKEVEDDDGRWYVRRITPYRTLDNHIEGVVVTFADISAAKRAQEVLRSSNVELERRVVNRTAELRDERNFVSTVLDTAPALIVVLDADGRVIRCNKACEATCKHRPDDVLGRSILDAGLIPDDELDDVRQLLDRLRAGEYPIRLEYHWQAADGDRRLIAWTHTVLASADGKLEYIIATGVDITERRRAEDEARIHQNALLHAHRTMTAGELSGALAHEVNQPLTAIANLCEATLLELRGAAANTAPIMQNLRAIGVQVERAGRTIKELRAFIARRDIEKTQVDVNELVRASIELVNPEASAHGIRIRSNLSAQSLHVSVAAIHIEHTLVNLLHNGIEAICNAGKTDGLVSIETRLGDADTVQIRVSDNGAGFGIDDPERAFEPFVTTKSDGLGLGLAIARSVVEANDGRLSLESSNGDGATLRIDLPHAQ